MAKIRIYIDLESLEGEDYKYIEIYECSSPDDDGSLIDTVPIKAGVDYVVSTLAIDHFNWFKLNILDGNGGLIRESDSAVLAEFSQDRLQYIRQELKDTNETNPAFRDEELIEKIRLAALRFNKIRNLSDVPENIWPIITILVRIDTCYVLAYDYARYIRLEIPGGAALSKETLYQHYLEIAGKLEEYYAKIMDSITKKGTQDVDEELESGFVSINVSTMILDRSDAVEVTKKEPK